MPWQKVALLGALVVLTLVPRLLDLDAFRSPDEDRWIANTSGFTTKLAHGRLDALIQQPHPGITTQWLGALAIRYDDWALKKVPLVIGQALLILLCGYVFGQLWGGTAGVATVTVLATNPLLYAHTRVYAMDSLLALFSALALGFLLLWHQKKGVESAGRYLAASAFSAAAAIMSKLPGVALLPIIGGTLLYWAWREKKLLTTAYQLQTTGVWLLAFISSLTIVLPSFVINPGSVIGDFLEFFRSDDYQELHQLGRYYYLGTLLFFSTPLHWLALAALAWLAWTRKLSRTSRQQLLILLMFAALMVIQMTIGAKKGDRYILSSFVMLDLVAAFVITKMYELTRKVASIRHYLLPATSYLLLAAVAWQLGIIWQTHPHTMAYVNPVTRTWFGERRHGWGEGLDVAAAYLNQKERAAELKIATYYPVEFDPYFTGEAVPAHQHDNPSVTYVLIYRAMLGRGEDAWETDIVKRYRKETPEKIIEINAVPMVWIYPQAAGDE